MNDVMMAWTRELLRQRLAKFNTEKYSFASLGNFFGKSKQAAVLIPLFLRNGDVHVLLTLRSSRLRTHGGDVAFPGGKKDDTDADEIETCLREAEEEIGLKKDQVEIVCRIPGRLSKHEVYVAPVVGLIPDDFRGIPNEEEVETIFSVPLSRFLTTEGHDPFDYETEIYKGVIHRFNDNINGVVITTWGLTATMCIELAVAVYGRLPPFRFSGRGDLDINDPFKLQKVYLENYLNNRDFLKSKF